MHLQVILANLFFYSDMVQHKDNWMEDFMHGEVVV